MTQNTFAMKGTFLYSISKNELIIEEGFLICVDGISQGIVKERTEKLKNMQLYDYSNQLIIPGLIDLHLHAPQYSYVGTGMDLELLEWLESYTFPEEAKYEKEEYAIKAYKKFVRDLHKSPTTRACIFATVHKKSSLLLMEMLENTGLITMVGKVNMDCNCPDYIREETQQSIDETISFIEEAKERFQLTSPILTPRFIPTCSDDLMRSLSLLKETYQINYQSHLSENKEEIQWVHELCPDSKSYGAAYDDFGAFSQEGKTIMAHTVYLESEEEVLLKEKNVFLAHCPESNLNIASGIAPVKRFLENGLKIGLATDVAGGSTLNMFRAMMHAIQSSKMYWRLIDPVYKPLTLEETFFIATKGGGEFFGKVGSFEAGYEVDAIVINDKELNTIKEMTQKERLERLLYLGNETHITDKFVAGNKVL